MPASHCVRVAPFHCRIEPLMVCYRILWVICQHSVFFILCRPLTEEAPTRPGQAVSDVTTRWQSSDMYLSSCGRCIRQVACTSMSWQLAAAIVLAIFKFRLYSKRCRTYNRACSKPHPGRQIYEHHHTPPLLLPLMLSPPQMLMN